MTIANTVGQLEHGFKFIFEIPLAQNQARQLFNQSLSPFAEFKNLCHNFSFTPYLQLLDWMRPPKKCCIAPGSQSEFK